MTDFGIYDEWSQQCLQAYGIMRKRRALIKKQLPHIDFGIINQVILLAKLWVEPVYRGQELGLRLMQEARHLFVRPQVFVILKAHPDGEKVTDADCLKLADYYCSSQLLGLKPLSKRVLPGCIVGNWWAPYRMTMTRPSGGHMKNSPSVENDSQWISRSSGLRACKMA